MARKHKKMALYEVLGRGFTKTRPTKSLERLHPLDSSVKAEEDSQRPGPAAKWPTRPKLLQINRGRVEISAPYQLAVAVLLGLVLLMLVGYRLGQRSAAGQGEVAAERAQQESMSEGVQTIAPAEQGKAEQAAATGSMGDHWIVIATWRTEAQLVPVREYFAQNGIPTEIKKLKDAYLLVTKARYENPQREGTDGYRARQQIMKIGERYKAPPGYGSFDFSTAYGMKVTD